MAPCEAHEAEFGPVKSDIKDLKEKCDSMNAEVITMKTQMGDVAKGFNIGVALLAVLQILGTAALFLFNHSR
jgi:tetrahydromethanopterin S-methyltransferase subunit G